VCGRSTTPYAPMMLFNGGRTLLCNDVSLPRGNAIARRQLHTPPVIAVRLAGHGVYSNTS
jgi:hypothetical protein